MGLHQVLLVVAVVLLILATLASWSWRPNWDHSYGHALGWAGLACYALAAIV
jgi:hypothetical protein